jgi:hypothetical protein
MKRVMIIGVGERAKVSKATVSYMTNRTKTIGILRQSCWLDH